VFENGSEGTAICNFYKGVIYACNFGGETSWKMKTRSSHMMALWWVKEGL
jgi:hypothetical protein